MEPLSCEEEVEREIHVSNEAQTTHSAERSAPGVTAHDEQTYATTRVTVIESEISSIKAQVSTMQSVLNAMEAAQVGDACPPGFHEKKFAVLMKRSADQLDNDIRAKEDDIRAKEDDIRRKEVEICKFQDDIRSLRQQEAGQQPTPQQTRSAAPPQPKFATVQAALDAISQQPVALKPEVLELSKGVKRCNVAAITKGLIAGVRILMKAFVEPADKFFVPLMCVLGPTGQGKTDTLNFIRGDANVQALLIQEINNHIDTLNFIRKNANVDALGIDETNEHIISTPRLSCKRIVHLFATFNQGSNFDPQFEPTIASALCNRLLSNYLGVIFDPAQSPRFDYITLRALTEFIRQREADKRRCKPAEICVIILVDEVLKVVSASPTDKNMKTMLDAICETQHKALINSATKDLTFAVVTSLEVDSIHACVTLTSGRPLHSIPLSPCSAVDIDDIVGKIVTDDLKPMYTSFARAELLWPAHGTGGHFRSLELLWRLFREDPSNFSPWQPVRSFRSAAIILDVMAKRLNNPLMTMKETDLIGATFSKQGVSMTLHKAAMNIREGVFYEATDELNSLVIPCVMPSALSERWPFEGDTDVAQSIVQLWNEMRKLLTGVKGLVVKGWEMGVPQLELIASTLIHEVNRKKPVGFGDVWRGAFVQPWADRQAKLFYRPVGKACVDVYRFGDREPTVQHNADDEAVRNARTSDLLNEEQQIKADDEALRNACKSDVPTLVRAETSNYPGIEGVHTMLEEELPCGARKLIPVLIQMKALKTVTRSLLETWTQKAHDRAKHLGLMDGSYFVVLYVSHIPDRDGWQSAIPPGTIVIKREDLIQFLSPFGMTPLLQMLDTHAD
ncbi:Hypothetical protein, putative [Bodo saltans]|uniref:Uncharacterized protein n=1 Tax=Bodo saltans TaxID=75058 RepID=A0A0S4JTW6_BODSA|nr:Hypothetical protein, putative [Bodo saltans]|eukprot:CUG93452.1 Hypothetical protein, putative [Bodo saltans]